MVFRCPDMGLWYVMAQLRNWVFTINNYTEQDEQQIKEIKDMYILYAYELSGTGTPHLQGYLYSPTKISRKALSKKISRACLEPAKGDLNENKAYIIGPYEKDGKTKPFNPNHIILGTEPSQGKRKDLDLVKNQILNHETTPDDIACENPILYHQYARTLTKIEDIALRRKFRTEMTTCTWYYGTTGTGKSHTAYEDFHPDTHYNWKDDGGWQDAYKQQEIVIINEFRGEIKYKDLLLMIDKWPYEIRRRNREPMPFTSKHIIITSALPPSEIYNNLNAKDSLEQLTRRIKIVQLTEKT